MLIIAFFYLLIIVGCMLFYILYKDIFSFYLLISAAVIPLLLFITMIINKLRIKMWLECSYKNAVCGRKIPVIINIVNRSPFPVSCAEITVCFQSLVFGSPKKITVNTPVYARNTQQLCLMISAEYCGKMEIYIKKAKIFDAVKLFKARIRPGGQRATVTVMPPISHINPQISYQNNVYSENDIFSKHRPGDDPSEIFALHEYRPGDRINRIHWKASGKKDDYIVKDFSLPLSNNIAIILCPVSRDISSKKYSENPLMVFTHIMSAAASMSAALIDAETQHTFIWSNGEENVSATVLDTEEYLRFMSLCLSTKLNENSKLAALNRYILQSESRFEHIIVITDICDSELLTMLTAEEYSSRKTVICRECSADRASLYTDSEPKVIILPSDGSMSVLSEMTV